MKLPGPRVGTAISLAVLCALLIPQIIQAGGPRASPVSVRARIQIGPPLSAGLVASWRQQDFALKPLRPPGTTIDALQAIEAADRAFMVAPQAYVFAVRYGHMTNPRQIHPYSAGYVWVVMYQHDRRAPTSCPARGCPPSLRHAGRYAQSNAVVDARTGQALFKFQTN